MKILFVLPQVGAEVPSFHAVSILSAVVKRAGHETSLLELRKIRFSALDEAIQRHDPDVVALTSVTQQIPYSKEIITYVKRKFPHIQTILGGTHSIVRPHVIEEIAGLDAVCTNEAEGPILEYLGCLEAGRPPIEVPNFRVRVGGEILTSRRAYSCTEEEMTALPFEDRELFPRWRDTPKGVPLESLGIRPRFFISRGCAFSCSFCSVPTLRALYPEKKFVRYPTAERAIAEIEAVADRWTFQTYVLDDDVFSHRPSWVIQEWAKKYPSRLQHLQFEMNLRVETASDELMRALSSTGCSLLKFGIESGDPEYRKQVFKRNITNEETREAFALARKYGMRCFGFNILGGRDETRGQIWKTVRLNQQLKPDKVQISVLYPYPGTPLGDDIIHAGDVVGQWDRVENYFERSAIKLKYLWPWEVKLYARLFRLLVYSTYSPRLAWQEILGLWRRSVRDRVKRLLGLHTTTARYDLEAATTQSVEK